MNQIGSNRHSATYLRAPRRDRIKRPKVNTKSIPGSDLVKDLILKWTTLSAYEVLAEH
jgi:hypothetical protein